MRLEDEEHKRKQNEIKYANYLGTPKGSIS